MACFRVTYRQAVVGLTLVCPFLLLGYRVIFVLVAIHTMKKQPYSPDDRQHRSPTFIPCTRSSTMMADFQSDFSQDAVLSFHTWFFLGTSAGFIIGSLITARYPASRYCAIAMVITAILHIALPMAMTMGSVVAVSLTRFINGVLEGSCTPGVTFILASWSLSGEKSRMMASSFIAMSLGNAITAIIAAVTMCYIGWSSCFYIYGAVTLLWVAVWTCTAYSVPGECSHLSDKEKQLFDSCKYGVKSGSLAVSRNVPYRKIFFSKAVLCIWFCRFSGSWNNAVLGTLLPQYLNSVHGIQTSDLGLMISVEPILKSFALFGGAFVADKLTSVEHVSLTKVRKLMQSTGGCSEALFILLGGLAPNWPLSFASFVAAFTSAGITENGYRSNVGDLSIQFSNIVTGIAMTGSVGGSASTLVSSFILSGVGEIQGWTVIFFLTCALTVVSTTMYVVFGSADRQSWDGVPGETKRQTIDK